MYGSRFKVYQLIFLALISSSLAYGAYYDFSNLNNLGDQITRDVNQQLAPLQNLGARISASVEQQLEPLRSGNIYPNTYNNGNRQFAGPYQPFIAPIIPNIQPVFPTFQPFAGPDLSGLNNLGQQIQQSVYQGLEPVRALEVISRMKNGVGGTTIATHLPEGKKFVIINYQMYQCSGTISEQDGKCSGPLTPFKINNKSDYCYNRQGFSIVNNQICIGASSISVINNDIKCVSYTGTPALLTTIDEFKQLCKGLSDSVEYKYIANPQDSAHVHIPNENKYVKCTNNEPGVCIFTEMNPLPNHSWNGNIIVNTYSGGANVVA